MINVSNEFKKLMNVRTDFKENAEITFADGTVLELKEKDFTVSNNSVMDGADTNGIPLGVAVCRNIQIEIMNDDERFAFYDFFGAKIRLYLTFQLSETVERIEYGTFTVLTPETYGETIIITALDDMYKADRDYSTNITYPASLQTILVDACNTLDISLGSTSFTNSDFVVNEKPTDITFRQLFGYIAMIAVGNARIDKNGLLQIITYDFDELSKVLLSEESSNHHELRNFVNLKIDTDNVVITGIKTVYTDEDNNNHEVKYGIDGYVLEIENPLIAGKEKEVVDKIGTIMVGGSFRQFSGDLIANPTCEFMDVVAVYDRKGNKYASFLTDITFQFFGFTVLKNSAEPALRNSAKPYSEATKTLVEAKKLVEKEKTAREQAVAQLANTLKNSSGLFMTEDVQPDGSTIYYMHDKPTLAESMVVWKLTSLAFGISTDGGKTYPYGFTVDGELITRLLYAEGINADYIDTGRLRISDKNGNTIFLADYDTKRVEISADNVFIGNTSVTQANKDLKDSITLEISNLQDQIDGNISTYNIDYVPTLYNYPAWDWTYNIPCNGTVQLRDDLEFEYKDEYYRKHARSVAFNTKTFLTYRFLKQEGTDQWYWMEVADSEYSYVLQQISQLRMTDEEIELSVKELEQEIINEYITAKSVESIIEQTAKSIKLDVSELYETKDSAIGNYKSLNSKIELTSEQILQSVSATYETTENAGKKYSNLESKITQTAESITSEVSKKYETKNAANKSYEYLSSKITQTAKSIELEVNRAQKAEKDLSAAIRLQATEISAKVSQTGGNNSSFGWKLTADGFQLISGNKTMFLCDDKGIAINGYTTTEQLNATKAYIELVDAQLVNTNNLVSQKASISDLNALSAKIASIESDYVNTSELNAEIVTVAGAISAVDVKVNNKLTTSQLQSEISKLTEVYISRLYCSSVMCTLNGVAQFLSPMVITVDGKRLVVFGGNYNG